MYTIYVLVNKENNMRYVGRSQQYHIRCSSWHYGRTPLARAMYKYGRHSFTSTIITHAINQLDAARLEAHYISLFHSNHPAFGYNSPNRSS